MNTIYNLLKIKSNYYILEKFEYNKKDDIYELIDRILIDENQFEEYEESYLLLNNNENI